MFDWFTDLFSGSSDPASGWEGLWEDAGTDLANDSYTNDFDSFIGDLDISSGDGYFDSTPSKDTGSSWYTNPGVILGGLKAGAGLLTGLGGIWQQEEASKRAREDEKFKYLLELAKLKYGQKPSGGGGRGGGGSNQNRNAALIAAIERGTDNQLQALNALGGNLAGAYLR